MHVEQARKHGSNGRLERPIHQEHQAHRLKHFLFGTTPPLELPVASVVQATRGKV